MVHPDTLLGRLGNRMFQAAFIHAYALKNGTDIYFQDPKWFEGYEAEIKQLFSQGIPRRTDQIAIHVRRGDYVGNSFYVDLMETPYYQDAMALFPGAEFIVFSDDIQFCKRQEIFKDCEFSEGNDELTDLNLMASCSGHIIANSSFSWWGAYLAHYKKKVVAPNKYKWYSDGVERTKCPESWIRI